MALLNQTEMNIGKTRLKQLLTDYIANKISEPDLRELLDFVANYHEDGDLDVVMQALLEEIDTDQALPLDSESLYQRITQHSSFPKQANTAIKQYNIRWWTKVAAFLLLGSVLIMLYYVLPRYTESVDVPALTKNKAIENHDKSALLRLADGSLIDLDSVSSGLLATQGTMQITLQGTALHYEAQDAFDGEETNAINTIITPRGRQYQVVLPDGTKIWLNAATELKYPVRFDPREARTVEVVGEAYFEVSKAKGWPFVVKTNSQRIQVLGTHFNVSAYNDDQATKTTLVEGRVRVSLFAGEVNKSGKMAKAIVLRPGEQAISLKTADDIKVERIDPEEVISWKQNLFVFNNEEVEAVMKKVSRWYDVEVEYEDGMEGKRIGGTIPRFENIEKLMEALKATGLLDYKMEGGKVIIME